MDRRARNAEWWRGALRFAIVAVLVVGVMALGGCDGGTSGSATSDRGSVGGVTTGGTDPEALPVSAAELDALFAAMQALKEPMLDRNGGNQPDAVIADTIVANVDLEELLAAVAPAFERFLQQQDPLGFERMTRVASDFDGLLARIEQNGAAWVEAQVRAFWSVPHGEAWTDGPPLSDDAWAIGYMTEVALNWWVGGVTWNSYDEASVALEGDDVAILAVGIFDEMGGETLYYEFRYRLARDSEGDVRIVELLEADDVLGDGSGWRQVSP